MPKRTAPIIPTEVVLSSNVSSTITLEAVLEMVRRTAGNAVDADLRAGGMYFLGDGGDIVDGARDIGNVRYSSRE